MKNISILKNISIFVLVFLNIAMVSATAGDVVKVLGDADDPLPVSGIPTYCSVGLAFDGTNLYYNRCGDSNIYKISPANASLVSTFDTISLTPNAMAFDATRNGIWFGVQSCDAIGMPIYFWDFDDNSVTLVFHVPFGLLNPANGESFLGFCFLDGLAFNANGIGDADDELWFSDDVNKNLGVFRPDGTLVTGYDATTVDPSLTTLSGLAIGGSNLYMANDGGGDVFRASIPALALVDQFTSGDERQEDMECDPNTFAPTEVMWVRTTPQGGAFPDVITAYEIEAGTCGVGGEGPICGNGILEGSEICDDGNLIDGDGCSAVCTIEEPVCPDNDGDGVNDCDDLCLNSVADNIPLNPNQYAQNINFGAFESGPGNDQSIVYDMSTTKGCTCKQIAQALGVGAGHIKKGCSPSVMETWTGLNSTPDRQAGIGKMIVAGGLISLFFITKRIFNK